MRLKKVFRARILRAGAAVAAGKGQRAPSRHDPAICRGTTMRTTATAAHLGAILLAAACAGLARAQDAPAAAAPPPALADSGRLLLTQGVSNIEGAAGGGLATWAVISGYGTRDAVGANAHFTYVGVPGYSLRDYGASVGLFDRVELSYTREEFDTGSTGGKLGLGDGFTFDQDIVGLKVKLFGDVVYDQNSLLPQVAVGLQYKHNDRLAIINAVGGQHADGIDYYIAATKLFLNQSLVVDATLRLTKANQTGLLGFGGDRNKDYSPEFEGSVGYLLSRRFVVGAEYRTKPNNLGFARENDWYDVFAAYTLSKNLSVTLAYADLGAIATFNNQRGVYVSLQAGF
jgi:hypothetical protein